MLSLLFGSHVCVERVVSDQVTAYLLKYEVKASSTGVLNVTADAAACLGLQVNESQLKLLSAALLSRAVSASHAAWTLSGKPWLVLSDAEHHVDTSPPELQRHRITPGKEVVVARLQELAHLTPKEYFRGFTVRDMEKIGKSKAVYRTGDMLWVHANAEDFIVTFTDFSPVHQPQGFFYNVLLERVAVPRLDDYYTPDGGRETHFDECRLRGIVRSRADLTDLIQRYVDHKLLRQDNVDALVDGVLQAASLDPDFGPWFPSAPVTASSTTWPTR